MLPHATTDDSVVSLASERLFWDRVLITNECWEWTGGTSSTGYGSFRSILPGGRSKYWNAHALAYTLLRGSIPPGHCRHHLCENRRCVRPAHIAVVSKAEHNRIHELGANNRDKTHCKRGHVFDDRNTYRRKDGGRTCRTCVLDQLHERRRRQREVRCKTELLGAA